MILAPGAVMTGNHEMYKVFTPFKNAWLKRLKEDIPPCVPAPKIRVSGALSTPLTPVSLNYPQQAFDAALFPVEENAVIAQLRQFCAQGADEYALRRDFLRLTAPVGFPPAWRRAACRRDSACTDYWRSSRRRWTAGREASG